MNTSLRLVVALTADSSAVFGHHSAREQRLAKQISDVRTLKTASGVRSKTETNITTNSIMRPFVAVSSGAQHRRMETGLTVVGLK